jgi:hypothetical protein
MSQRYPHPLPFLDSLESIESWPLAKDCLSDEFQKDLTSVKEALGVFAWVDQKAATPGANLIMPTVSTIKR